MTIACIFVVACAAAVLASPARAQDAEAPPAPRGGAVTDAPPITPLRYTEDYSYLRDAARRSGDPWEPLKYVPLNADGSWYLTLGGEARARYESYADNVLGPPSARHDDYVWTRLLPYADLHLGPNVRAFGQLVSAFKIGDEPDGPVDEDRLDLLQAFVDLDVPVGGGASLTLRPGRQLLAYGSERLIGTRYGPNVLQAFDAARATFRAGALTVDGFYARPVRVDPEPFDDAPEAARSVWGAYGTYLLPAAGPRVGVDLYYIGYDNDRAFFAQGPGDERRHTAGARVFGARSGWAWNYEFFYQFGRYAAGGPAGRGDVSAWSVATETAYTFEHLPLHPTLGLRANVVSGDDDPGDVDLQAFNPLFPKGKYFGEIGLIGPYNLVNVQPAVILHPTDRLTLTAAAVFYWRQSTDDGVYNAGGQLVRPPADAAGARYIGTQLDLVVGYAVDRHLSVEGVYSTFFPGDFVRQTGSADVVRFVGLEVLYRF